MSNDKKKILYLLEYPIDLAGGGQESTKTLCSGLAANGAYEPIVACPKLLATTAADYPYRIVTYPSDENRELSKIRRIKNFLARIGHFHRIIKEVQPDLIHVSMSESMVTYAFLRVPGFFSKIPFVYTDRGLFSGYRKMSRMCIKAGISRASRMLTTTAYNAGLWEKEIKTPVTIIPNTISNVFADFDPQKRMRGRERCGIGTDELVIGFAGRISEEKDWDKAPLIVEALAKAGIKFKVALVLSVYEQRDAGIVKTIKDGITKITGEDGLIYMQDLNQQQMSDYYYMVDIFIMTSRFESFGKAAVEAMSRKCIVLSTAVGGLPEVIGNKEDLYDVNDLSTLVERVRFFLNDPVAAQSEREMFYDRYRDNYTVDRNIEGHKKVYDEILGMEETR